MKVIATVHDVAGARVGAQVFSCEKDVGFVPAMEIELRSAVAAPAFVTVTVMAADVVPWVVAGKVSDVALSVSVGSATPVPVRVTTCGLPAALSAIERIAEYAAAEAGLKATKILQFAPAASVVPHVCSCSKSPGLVPPREMEEKTVEAPPIFVTVTT